jgi:hypothetical protein
VNSEQFKLALQELGSQKEDIRPSDVVIFSEPLRSALNNAVRLGSISLTDFAKELDLDRGQAAQISELLVARNLFRVSDTSNERETYYDTRLSALSRPLARPKLDIWKKIGW